MTAVFYRNNIRRICDGLPAISDALRSELLARVVWEEALAVLGLAAKKKTSGVFVLLCIFHAEKTPSLWLRPSGMFYCYGCGAAGDVVDFVMWRKNLWTEAEVARFFHIMPALPTPGQLPLPFSE